MKTFVRIATLFCGVLAVGAAPVFAQSTTSGAIAGIVKDTTGAVLPGVTVEAASPALIEKVRSVVTDDQGNYKITDLRPGMYSVTFTLAGFNTFKRDGIELSAGFTANISPAMAVGSMEETITVSGAAPIVDVQNVRSQNVITAQVMANVPTSRNFMGMVALTLGATGGGGFSGPNGQRDVGGNNGEGTSAPAIHGSRADGVFNIEGMKAQSLSGDGTNRRFHMNQLAIEETVLETGGQSAETETGGVSANVILREGGNTFRGLVDGDYTGRNLQGSNLSDALRARGLTSSNHTKFVYSYGASIGGPLAKDKVWFNTSFRAWGNQEELAGIYYNKPELRGTRFYQADTSNPGFAEAWVKDSTSRVAWQATKNQKVSGIFTFQRSCGCNNGLSATRAPETTVDFQIGPGLLDQVNWKYTRTNRLLFEAGFASRHGGVDNLRQPETDRNAISYVEQLTGLTYNNSFIQPSTGGIGYLGRSDQYNTAGAVSYVTGSHALKVGWQTMTGKNPSAADGNDPPVQYTLRGGVPVSVTVMATPVQFFTHVGLLAGLFAQDQWTLSRLTLNLGVRYDHLRSFNPATTRPAGVFLGELKFNKVDNVPNWKDIDPRVGAAYDLFGNGKTAIKGSMGRYVVSEATAISNNLNPSARMAITATRTWSDANGNFAPDCVLTNNAANGECGPQSASTFGTPVFNTGYDPDFLEGSGVRPYNWQSSLSVQQELGRGMGLTVGYFRTSYGNITVTDNLALTSADFDPFCITAPTDTRLGSISGTQVCGLYDIKPSRFGQVNNQVRVDDDRSEVFNGVDIGFRSRFGDGGLLNVGGSIGKTHVNNCSIIDNPSIPSAGAGGTVLDKFCEFDNRQDQFKLNVSYPLMWGIQVAGLYQNIPGAARTSTLVVPNAQIAPSLGRNLGSCGAAVTCTGTASIALLAPQDIREKRASQMDLRFSKTMKLNTTARVRVGFDIYNVLNSNDVIAMNLTYGAAWLRPANVLAARLYKFNARFDF